MAINPRDYMIPVLGSEHAMKNFRIMTDTIHEDGPPGLPMADPSTFDTLWSQRTRVDYEYDKCVKFWTGDTEGYYVIASKRGANPIAYLVKYQEFSFEGKPAVEVSVWRDVTNPYNIGVTDDFFFNILLGKYEYVRSTPIETKSGHRLWVNLSVGGWVIRHKYGFIFDPDSDDVEWEERKIEECHGFSGPKFGEREHYQIILKRRMR